MKLNTFNPALLGVAIETDGSSPAYLQLYEQLRDLILSGRLSPGDRLPSTRAFASELSLSRTTLVAAYDQLQSEGYLETRPRCRSVRCTVLASASLAGQCGNVAEIQGAGKFFSSCTLCD